MDQLTSELMSPSHECQNLVEAFVWADVFLRTLVVVGWQLLVAGECLRRLSISTAFSGIDAPGVAGGLLRRRYQVLTGERVRSPHLAATELST